MLLFCSVYLHLGTKWTFVLNPGLIDKRTDMRWDHDGDCDVKVSSCLGIFTSQCGRASLQLSVAASGILSLSLISWHRDIAVTSWHRCECPTFAGCSESSETSERIVPLSCPHSRLLCSTHRVRWSGSFSLKETVPMLNCSSTRWLHWHRYWNSIRIISCKSAFSPSKEGNDICSALQQYSCNYFFTTVSRIAVSCVAVMWMKEHYLYNNCFVHSFILWLYTWSLFPSTIVYRRDTAALNVYDFMGHQHNIIIISDERRTYG